MATRRAIILAGGAALAAAGYGASWLPRLWEPALAFEPMDEPAGFRRLEGGPVSAASDPMIGLSQAPAAVDPPAPGELCAALFGPAAGDAVPVAAFSDYNCPYCRVVTQRIFDLSEELRLNVRWHELPLLGDASRQAARGALAADMQGRYAAFHDRLMRTSFHPTPAYLAGLGDSVGIDSERMLADMDSDAVTGRLRTTHGVAQRFRLAGTPSIVIGRTLVEGAVDARTLRRIVVREREEGAGPCS